MNIHQFFPHFYFLLVYYIFILLLFYFGKEITHKYYYVIKTIQINRIIYEMENKF